MQLNSLNSSPGGSVPFSAIQLQLQLGYKMPHMSRIHGGRCWGTAGTVVHERSGSSTKGRTPNIRYGAFYKSHPALGVFSTKVSLLLKGFQQIQPAFGELVESPLSESFCRAFRELPES